MTAVALGTPFCGPWGGLRIPRLSADAETAESQWAIIEKASD